MVEDINILLSYAIRETADIAGLDAIAGQRAQIAVNKLDEKLVRATHTGLVERDIDVRAIHLRRLPPEYATRTLAHLRDLFGVTSFSLHADKRTPDNAYYSWIEELRELNRAGIVIGFENGRKTGSWLRNPYDLPKDPLFKLVLDTGHLRQPEQDIEIVEQMGEQVLGIHLTAEPQGPYNGFRRLLPWMFRNPSKEYVLEYGRDNIELMLQDSQAIRNLFDEFAVDAPKR